MSLTLLTPPVPKPVKTTLWYTRCPVPNALGLALRAGKLHEEFGGDAGIELRSVLDSPDAHVHDAHYYGTLSNALRLGGNVPPIWSRSRDANTRLIGIAWTTAPAPILALKSSSIRSAADLKGRRVLVIRRPGEEIDFPYAGALRNYETALATAGLNLDDVVLVEKTARPSSEHSRPASESFEGEGRRPHGSGHNQLIVPLLSGEVDAIVSHGPAAVALIEGFDLHVVHDLTAHSDPIQRFHNSVPRILTVDARLIEQHFDLLTRIVARFLEVPQWAAENPDQAVHFTALEQGVADDLIARTYAGRLVPELELNLSPDNVARIAAQKEYLLKRGFIAKDFDLDRWMDPTPLEAAHLLLAERRKNPAPPAPAKPPSFPVGPAGCVAR